MTRRYPEERRVDKDVFDRKVEKYTEDIETSPGLYKARVLAFALVGYAAYALMMLTTIGLLVGVVTVLIMFPSGWLIKLGLKALIPIGLLIFAMFAALRVGSYIPEGLKLTREHAPALFDEIDRMRAALQVPPLARVIVTDDFNASVIQNTRWGFFGTSSTLVLGMPLMQALSPRDLKVVIAHELGHLSGNHSRFSGWIYRAVRTYSRLLESTGGSAVVESFLNWYVPRLDALSFPLRRQNEYEADAAAAELHGEDNAAQALANVNIRAALLGDFWASISKQIATTEHPPVALFHDWAQRIPQQDPKSAADALRASLEEETGTDDTHPSLKDRIEALSGSPYVETFEGKNAAEEFLGTRYSAFVEQTGHLWSSGVHQSWRARHAQFVKKRAHLATLEEARRTRALNADEAFEYADLFEDVCPDEDALPYFQAALELSPNHEPTRFAVGRLLLDRDDPKGQSLLESFTKHEDPEYRMASANLLSRYHFRNDNDDEANKVLEAGRAAAKIQAEREREHNELRAGDTFAPHDLSNQKLETLTLKLAVIPELKVVYLVQKIIAHASEPTYVLAFTTRKGFMSDDDEDDAANLKLQSTINFLGPCWFLPLADNGAFKKKITGIEGAEIYSV